MLKAGKTYKVVSDERGSVRYVIDANSSEIAQEIRYDIWGNVTFDSNPGFQPFYYAGGLYDQDSKLTRFGARDYDATTGRWLDKEPLGFVVSKNFYAYVDNDPVNKIDPTGLVGVAGAVVGGLGGAAWSIGEQLLGNGGNFSCINWGEVATGAAIGAAFGATGGFLGGAASAGQKVRKAQNANKVLKAKKATSSLKNKSGNPDVAARAARTQPHGGNTNQWRRNPRNLSEKLAMDEAKAGAGRPVIKNLSDPRYKGWEKWQHTHKNPDGSISNIHYNRNPSTGYKTDFKYK